MVDENYFEDFNRRRPRRQAYRGSYRNPGSSQFFDPSADILAGIESVEKTIGDRKTAVRDFENAAAVKRQETLDSIRDTDSMSDTTAIDSLQQQLMNEVDELYKLDIASFEGDRSAYLKKASEVNKIVETIPALMGLIDAEGETLKENQSSSQDFFKKLLRSNDPNYYDFVDAASKGGPGVSFRMQNGNIIAQLNGKDIFNGNAYVKAKKNNGFDLVKYAGDYTPQIDKADALASKGLNALVSKEVIEKVNKGIELVGEEKTNYTLARQKYEERLRSGNIPIPVNESTYQMFGNYGKVDPKTREILENSKDPWGKDLKVQEGATKEAIIQYMIDQKFPKDVVTTKTTVKPGMTLAQQKAEQRANAKLQFEKMKFTIDQIQTAKTEQELQRSIDFYLNRNLEHAAKVSKMPKNSKQRADETVKLLNEARGIEELGFKTAQGIINESGEFEENSESKKYYILDADGALVQGVGDNIGLVDALNQETVYRNLNMDTRSEIKPYVTNRMANFSKQVNAIENKKPAAVNEKVKGEDTTIPIDFNELNKYVDNTLKTKLKNINLQEYNKYRKKQGLEEVTQSDFDTKYKPTLINDATEIVVGGTAKDNISLIIYNEIDDYARKNKGKKSDPKSIL
tara:strand:+ start:836 stop:2722 length:1887 start_codon:yes stop_codon:yes gene_type:complete